MEDLQRLEKQKQLQLKAQQHQQRQQQQLARLREQQREVLRAQQQSRLDWNQGAQIAQAEQQQQQGEEQGASYDDIDRRGGANKQLQTLNAGQAQGLADEISEDEDELDSEGDEGEEDGEGKGESDGGYRGGNDAEGSWNGDVALDFLSPGASHEQAGLPQQRLASGRGDPQSLRRRQGQAVGQGVLASEAGGAARRRSGTDAEREHRRMKRLLRNRVSAQQARERKKLYLNELEVRLAALEQRHGELEERLSTLQRENYMLHQVVKNTSSSLSPAVNL